MDLHHRLPGGVPDCFFSKGKGVLMPHTILIADDDETILTVLENYLGRCLGYRVVTAADGIQALDLAMKEHIDLCLLDVRMPGLDGTELYTRLKVIYPQLEAIFFTGDHEFENKLDFLRFSLPLDRVLTKPLDDLSTLTRLLIGILGPPIR